MNPVTSSKAIAYVQSAKYTNDNASGSAATTLAKAGTAGNTLIAVVSWGDKDAPALSATDNAGNVYAVAVRSYDSGNRQGLAILYAINAKGGATTTTVSLGTSLQYRRLITLEYSNIASLDMTTSRLGTASKASNGVSTPSVVTTAAGELIFGAVMDDSGSFGSITAGTGFTQRNSTNNTDMACQDMIQAQAGSVASTQTFSKADSYLAEMATFKSK